MRVLITGGPKTGKTTLSKSYFGIVRHTDDIMDLPWSVQSEEISHWLDLPGPWTVEGVAVVRALRKWLQRNAHGLPFDKLLYLDTPVLPRTPAQEGMATRTKTIWWEIYPLLLQRKASIYMS